MIEYDDSKPWYDCVIIVSQKVPFKNIWHTGEGEFVCKHFMLANSTKTDERFRCSLRIKQEQNDQIAEIDISNPVKVSNNSGRSISFLNFTQLHMQCVLSQVSSDFNVISLPLCVRTSAALLYPCVYALMLLESPNIPLRLLHLKISLNKFNSNLNFFSDFWFHSTE